MAAFYALARAADDVADHPAMASEEKLSRLARFAAALEGEAGAGPEHEAGARLRVALRERDLGPGYALDLLSAFRQDVVKRRYASLDELVEYCRRSANPVGRFLVDLHGESAAVYPASDALCTSLQVLNHLQDCGDDYRSIDRVYLPEDWMAEAGARMEDLAEPRASAGLRLVIDRLLGECRAWNARAVLLPSALKDRRFAAEAGAIVHLARRLAERLAREDPLRARVKLSKAEFAVAALRAIVAALRPRPA